MKKTTSLKELFAEYISKCRYSSRLRPETVRGYEAVFRTFSVLMPHVVDTADLTEKTMNEFFKTVEVRKRIVGRNTEKVGVKASTIRTYWNKLNTFCEWLYVREHIPVNPLKDIKPAYPHYDDNRAVTKEDINKIFSAVILHADNSLLLRRDTLIFSLLVFCGLRIGELLGLEVKDVDIAKRILTVRGETSKSNRTRQIPINPTLLAHLLEYVTERNKRGYKTPSLLVSSNEDRGLSIHGMKHFVKKYNDLSGVKFHVHRFRHSFACALANQNSSAIKIQKLMGHTDLRMTQRYLRSMSVEDLRDDVNMLNIDNFI